MVSGPRPRLKPGGDADVALRLVEGAFERLRRPLKVCDLYDEAVEQDISELLTARVSASVSRLIKFGYVEDVGRVRGIRSGGTRLVVPAGRAGEAVGGSVASWPQRVVDTILVLWAEHAAEAAGQGVLPRPVSTLELRQRLSEDPRNVEDLGRPNALPSVVRNLLKLHHPPVRTVGPRRVSGSFFVPTDVQDAQIDVSALAFASDADRVVEATRRACMAQRRPIVTREEVLRELDSDGALALSGGSTRSQALDRITQTTLHETGGRRRARQVQRVAVVGRVGGRAHYCLGLPGAVELAWAATFRFRLNLEAFEKDGAELASCTLPALRAARLARVAVRATELTEQVQRLSESLSGDAHAASVLADCGHRIAGVAAKAAYSATVGHSAALLCATVPVPAAFRLLGPAIPDAEAYDRVVNVAGPGGARKQMRPMLRRHVAWWVRDDGTTMYERTGLLLACALWWGGPTTVTNAMLASAQLGSWRVPAPLLTDLADPDPEHRLAAIACSAFLACPATLSRLRHMTEADAEPGVRLAALWALGIAEWPGVEQLADAMAAGDSDPRARETAGRFAAAAVQSLGRGWFVV